MTPSSEPIPTDTMHGEVRIAGGGAVRMVVRFTACAGHSRRFKLRGVCEMAA